MSESIRWEDMTDEQKLEVQQQTQRRPSVFHTEPPDPSSFPTSVSIPREGGNVPD